MHVMSRLLSKFTSLCVGRTALKRRLAALHRMLPPALRADFQDLAAWRSGTHEILDLVVYGHEGPVLIPMTLVNPRYFAQVVSRLRDDGCCCYVASCCAAGTVGRGLR
jgi:hypothetical protein